MTESTSLFFFALGLHFALLQFSYFFMLEVFFSSRALSYFVVLFFWLAGFLSGLNSRRKLLLGRLLLFGLAAYYAALLLNRLFSFRGATLAATAACIAVSGAAPGYFFGGAQERSAAVRPVFLHENNGFVLGTLLSLLAMLFAGKWLLVAGPLATALPLLLY